MVWAASESMNVSDCDANGVPWVAPLWGSAGRMVLVQFAADGVLCWCMGTPKTGMNPLKSFDGHLLRHGTRLAKAKGAAHKARFF
jgi:hypothetical protein